MTFMNVKEQWFMYDTVAVTPYLDSLTHPISGWFNNFNDLGMSDSVSFFDSRNKSIGLAYNNQDSRDQIPYALVAESISVGFFAPSTSSQLGTLDAQPIRGRVDTVSSFWDNELPQHASAIFRVNQDDRLKTTCAMMAPGYGPVGSACGQGNTSAVGGMSNSVHASGFGAAHLKYRWDFPTGIGIPRRATVALTLQFTEWARTAFQTLWGPGNAEFWDFVEGDPPTSLLVYKPTFFMIQCLIQGKRQVQQRGEYHAS
ncbi:MAG: hypothetical protein KAV87_17480 [Desulfobacteraceae bacterium]|nr:hypothetical protein [Desulfobacteraceae bacterium]